jgi:acyl-CoA thioesterase I
MVSSPRIRRFAAYGVWIALIQAIALIFATPALAQGSKPREKLVLAFGDSLMAGYGLKPNESFPAQLQGALRAGGIPARVHNGGVSGDTTAAGKARLNFVLAGLKAKPDLVILELGANDMLRGIQPAQTRANLEAMIVELKRRKIPVLLAGMLASPNLGKAYAAQFNPIYPALAKKHGLKLYPFFMQGVAANRSLLIADQMHPNGKGVAVVVRGIYPQVAAMLR